MLWRYIMLSFLQISVVQINDFEETVPKNEKNELMRHVKSVD